MSDLPELRRLFGDLRALELALVPWSIAQKQAFLDDQFGLQHAHFTRFHPKCDFWVIEQGLPLQPALPVGRLYLDRSGEWFRIVDIGLFGHARGGGLGGELIAWAQSEAAAAGRKGIKLHVAENNPRARALYLRTGFTDDGAVEGNHQPMVWAAP